MSQRLSDARLSHLRMPGARLPGARLARLPRVPLAAVAGLVTLGLLATPSAPRAQSQAQPEAGDRALRVASYNIHHGSGNDTCTPPAPSTPPGADCALRLDRIADIIRDMDVDVIGLQEVDRLWARSGGVDQAARLSRDLRLFPCYAANLDHQPDNHATQPHQYGTLILSKHPILACGNTLLPKANPASEQRGLAHALINVRGVPTHVYNTHLHTALADRAVQITAIDTLISGTTPAILLGDFNAQPTESTLAPLQARFQDVWTTVGTGPGFTYPAAPAATPNRRIDFIFATRDITVSDAAVVITPDTSMAADHYPLVTNVLVPGSAVGVGRERP